jgi:CBS-domain-containing membrane protein
MQVEQVMSKNVHHCCSEDSLDKVAQLMWDNDCGCLPVCRDDESGEIIGMVTDRDIAMCAMFQGKSLNQLNAADAMARDVQTCLPTQSIAEVESMMSMGRIRRLPVVNKDSCLVGMISLADLAHEAANSSGTSRKQITGEEITETLAAICSPCTQEAAQATA